MSDFMPGVKVLLQVAQQQVDIREERGGGEINNLLSF